MPHLSSPFFIQAYYSCVIIANSWIDNQLRMIKLNNFIKPSQRIATIRFHGQ